MFAIREGHNHHTPELKHFTAYTYPNLKKAIKKQKGWDQIVSSPPSPPHSVSKSLSLKSVILHLPKAVSESQLIPEITVPNLRIGT